MAGFTIRTKGTKSLRALLQDASGSMDTITLRGVFFDGVKVIHQYALANVRKLYKRRTGNLEASLVAQAGYGKRATAWAKARRRIAPHAHLLEFGHKIVHGSKTGLRDTGKVVQGSPFFRPAVDETKTTVKSLIADRLRQHLGRSVESHHSTPDETGWIG